jgi:hypothetical protein
MMQSDLSTASQREEPATANTYKLSCVDCSFETTVRGDIYDTMDVVDTHQEEYGTSLTGHFVNFQMEQQR